MKHRNRFKGGFEPQLAKQLTNAKIRYTYETKIIPYVLTGKYKPDFILANGIIIEAKGRLYTADKRKLIAVKQQHPELDIRIVFQNASNKMSRHTDTTYGEWATRNGFMWSDRSIPKSWLVNT